MINGAFIISSLFAVIIIAGMLTDTFKMKLPNWLFLAFTILFIFTCWFYSISWNIWRWNLLALVVVLFVGFLLFALSGGRDFGAGDAKFIAGIALWMGFDLILVEYLIFIGLYGGALAILFLFLKLYLFNVLPPWRWLEAARKHIGRMPYGIAIGGAGLTMFRETEIFHIIFGL